MKRPPSPGSPPPTIKTHGRPCPDRKLERAQAAPGRSSPQRCSSPSSSPRRGCGRASPTTSCARSPTSPRSLPRLLKRRDLAIGARAGAQRTGARGADGAATAGPHQRSLLRPSVARATGRPRERPSRRGGGLSAARAARRAALLRRRQPLFRAGAWRRRSSDRASGRCSAHPSRAPRARCCCRRRRPLLAVFPSVCPTLITVAAHGSLPAPTLHVRTVVGICMYAVCMYVGR